MSGKPTCDLCGGAHPTVAHDQPAQQQPTGEVEKASLPSTYEKVEHKELHERLRLIIQTVSGRPDLEVTTELTEHDRRAMEAQGQDPEDAWFRAAFVDPKTGKMVREYVHIPERIFASHEDVAKGAAAHEAGHVLITRLGEVVPEHVMREPGFAGLLMSSEERPTDQVVRVRYEGAGAWVDACRKDQVLEAQEIRKRLPGIGRVPRFQQVCDLIVFAPHGEISTGNYDQEVLDLYERVRADIEKIEHTLPEPGTGEAQAKAKSIERYQILREKVWPEYKQLVAKDMEDEQIRKMLERGTGGGPGGQPNPEIAKALQELSEALREQLAQAIKEALEQIAAGKPSEGTRGAGPAVEGKPEAGQPSEGTPSAGQPPKPLPLDTSKLDPALKEALQKVFAELSKQLREEISRAAKAMMEKIDDAIVEERGAKLTGEPPMTHERRRAAAKEGKEVKAKKEAERRTVEDEKKKERERREQETRHEIKELERRIAAAESKTADPYNDVFQEIRPQADKLYRELDEVFRPLVQKKKKLRSTGASISLPAVFRWESARDAGARNLDNKIFEKRETPQKKDYAITLLVDLSGSMSGEKIEETFKGVVLLTEVLNKLGVRFEILGFQQQVFIFKKFSEQLDDAKRKMISTIQGSAGGWNADGPCLREASRSLGMESAKEKFLIVFSDGLPVAGGADPRQALHDAVSDIRTKTDQKLLGLGLGQGTEHVRTYYPNSLPDIDVKQLAATLGALLGDMINHPEKYS